VLLSVTTQLRQVRHSFAHLNRLAALCLAAELCLACSSTDPLLLDDGELLIEDGPPITSRMAVAPFVLSGQLQSAPGLSTFQDPGGALRDLFVEALREQNVADEVIGVGSSYPRQVSRTTADLLVRPRLHEIELGHVGVSSRWFVSSLLWLTTWIGTTFVEDSVYDARMNVSCEVIALRQGAVVVDYLELTSERVELTFWERNSVLSFGFFQ